MSLILLIPLLHSNGWILQNEATNRMNKRKGLILELFHIISVFLIHFVSSLETNLVASNVVVQNGTISHSQLLDTLPSVDAQIDSEVADEILKASLYVYNSKCAPQSISGEHCETILSDIVLPTESELAHKCQSIINGRNNGDYALRRLLPRHYKDGFYKV